MQKRVFSLISGMCCSITLAVLPVIAGASDESKMSFFITSVGVGNGADLGGLEGADIHCTSLATSVGAGNRTWR